MARAAAYLDTHLRDDPTAVIPFADVMVEIGEANRSNFNRTIRTHVQFVDALYRLGVVEIKEDGGRYYSAFQRNWQADPDGDYAVDA